jgi:chromosome segregation ATPase
MEEDAAGEWIAARDAEAEIKRLTLELQASHTLTRELNDQIERLREDNRVLDDLLNTFQLTIERYQQQAVTIENGMSQQSIALEKAEAERADLRLNLQLTEADRDALLLRCQELQTHTIVDWLCGYKFILLPELKREGDIPVFTAKPK